MNVEAKSAENHVDMVGERGGDIILNGGPAQLAGRSLSSATRAGHSGGLAGKLALWGLSLVFVGVLSVVFHVLNNHPSPGSRIGLDVATSLAYTVVFFHCTLRLYYSRWPSWLLFTVGFGTLTLSGLVGVVSATPLGRDLIIRENLELFRTAMLPMAAVVLLAAAYASRARARGNRIGTWKTGAKLAFMMAVVVAGWKLGALAVIGRFVLATSDGAGFLIDASSAVALAVLVVRTRRIVVSSRDEIVVPTAYWAVAMLLGRLFSIADRWVDGSLWWNVSVLELAGISALLLGLGLANEAAQRSAAEKMHDLEAMQDVSWSLVGATSLSELSQALAHAMASNFNAVASAVYLSEEVEEELVVAAVSGITDKGVAPGKVCSMRPDRRKGFHSGHTAKAFASSTIQVVPDIHSDVEFLPWRTVAQHNGVVISVPLRYRSRVIGVVNLFVAGVSDLRRSQYELLESLAAAVAPSIESARLRETISDHDVELREAA